MKHIHPIIAQVCFCDTCYVYVSHAKKLRTFYICFPRTSGVSCNVTGANAKKKDNCSYRTGAFNMEQPQLEPVNTDNADMQGARKVICVVIMICMTIYYVWFAPAMVRMESSAGSNLPCILPSNLMNLDQQAAATTARATVAVATAVNNASLLAGVVLLANARHHMATDRVVEYVLLYSGSLSVAQRHLLHNHGMHGVQMPPIFESERFRTMGHYDQYEKLYAWNMTDYELVIYLDINSTVVGDISPLTRCPGFCMKRLPSDRSGRFEVDDRVVVVRPDALTYRKVSDAFHGYVYSNPTRTLRGFMSYYFFHHCVFEPASESGVVRYLESVKHGVLEYRVVFEVKSRGVRDLDAPSIMFERNRCRTLSSKFNYAPTEDWSVTSLLVPRGKWRDAAERWLPWIVPETPVILTGQERRMC